MELRSIFYITIFLFLLASPGISEGGSDCLDKEIYEIDYRGPETHCFFTPPDHSHERQPWRIHQQSDSPHHKFKVFKIGRKGGKVRKNHG